MQMCMNTRRACSTACMMAPARLSKANFTPRYGFVFMRTCTEHNVLAACFCYSYHSL